MAMTTRLHTQRALCHAQFRSLSSLIFLPIKQVVLFFILGKKLNTIGFWPRKPSDEFASTLNLAALSRILLEK